MARARSLVVFGVASFLLVAACGGGLPDGKNPMGKLADRTFAGQNKCNPKNAERPFIIEWDATDQSSFQSFAANDVVYVHYEGCNLKVLDGCRDDSVKGSFGSYKPVEWTSGGVEVVDIHDENELYSKLPLGAATLSGRVQTGEKFHMEYYVSGTRTATRDRAYKGDLAKNPRCKDATHFVYAYNLGAFALAAQSQLKGQINGSYFGFGAGAQKQTSTNAEKKGGDLASCKGESAKEIESCKVPVRLTLRELSEGNNPEASASKAPETDASLNLAGKLQATSDAERNAEQHWKAAQVKYQARDGKGCLAELDQHDQLDPRPEGLSTNPATGRIAGTRAECLMLAGQCDAGKQLFRKALETAPNKSGQAFTPERIDTMLDAEAATFCTGSGLSERDQYLRAMTDLRNGGFGIAKKTSAECQSAFDTFMKLRTKVQRKDADDSSIPEKPLLAVEMGAVGCFAKAGDCAAAWNAHKAIRDAKVSKDDGVKIKDEKILRKDFEGKHPSCKGK
ncbi:MAG: hypothetical protein JST00_42080 [Deltaproteobacteria bacterium]|nr:hypothetical protein [Deltaproteobacteria bacterium]